MELGVHLWMGKGYYGGKKIGSWEQYVSLRLSDYSGVEPLFGTAFGQCRGISNMNVLRLVASAV